MTASSQPQRRSASTPLPTGLENLRVGGRYAFFTNECVGLGHLRRTMTIAGAVHALDPTGTSLVVTGSAALLDESPPDGVEILKLPAVGRNVQGGYESRTLAMTLDGALAMRADLARVAVTGFKPQVVVVDKLPLGIGNELLPALTTLRREGRSRIVLGLRDIEDDPSVVRTKWRHLRPVLRRFYDGVLVYGPESGQDALACMGWAELELPVDHVGYVGAELPAAGSRPADLPADFLLVASGGGLDGFGLSSAVIAAVRHAALPLPVVLVTGPLMPCAHHDEVVRLARGLDVSVHRSRPDMAAVVVGARAMVTMAGYNTVSEALRAGKPTMLVPRTGPSSEQLIRAVALSASGAVLMLHPDDLAPSTLRLAMDRLLARRRPMLVPDEYDGAARAARIIASIEQE